MRRIDIALLALLGPAGQQNHQPVAIAPAINPVSRSEIDAKFEHASANRFHVGEVATPQPGHRARNFCSGNKVQVLEPVGEWSVAAGSDVIADSIWNR